MFHMNQAKKYKAETGQWSRKERFLPSDITLQAPDTWALTYGRGIQCSLLVERVIMENTEV